MTIVGVHPELGGDGRVRLGLDGPAIEVVLPRHVIGVEGSDVLEWRARTVSDEDEVETTYVSGELEAVVRQDFDASSWRVRTSLANGSQEAVSVSRTQLTVRPGVGQAWAWAAGDAGLVVLVGGDGVVWALSVRRGSLRDDSGELVWLDAGTVLPAGGRAVLELAGRRCGDWGDVFSMLPTWLPPLAVRGDEPVDLALPDAGLVAPGCSIVEGPEGTEIRGSGLQQVDVHGAFGEVHLELAFAPALTEAVDACARQLGRLVGEDAGALHHGQEAAWDVRGRGLERTASSLIVLQSAHSEESAELLGGWLVDEVADLLESGGEVGPFAVAAMAGEAQRRDDRLVIGTLLDALPRVEPGPGQVLALTRVWAVLWGLGQDPEPVREALARVAGRPGRTRLETIEQRLVVGDSGAAAELLAFLGAGLPGAPMPVRERWEMAYAVALTSLVADPDGPRLVQAAEVAARRLTAEDPNDPEVLAWLLLGER